LKGSHKQDDSRISACPYSPVHADVFEHLPTNLHLDVQSSWVQHLLTYPDSGGESVCQCLRLVMYVLVTAHNTAASIWSSSLLVINAQPFL